MARETANDRAWARAFEEFEIASVVEQKGFIDLTAKELKEATGREPRHLGKIDHAENLPEVFKRSGLSILTLSNSSYRVGPYSIFQPLPAWEMPGDEVEVLSFPPDLETLDFQNLTGEPGVINAAYVTDMLHKFCEEELLLTVAGRMRTGDFNFSVDTHSGSRQEIQVNSAQIEIDAGYEGNGSFYIFEVKNHSATNFNFRQLYYPYRAWTKRITKPAVPIFLTFSNDIFDLYQFGLSDPNNFSSAELVKHKRYMLSHTHPETKEIVKAAEQGRTEPSRNRAYSKGIPFPQADDFGRVIDLVTILIDTPQSVGDLASYFGFDPRQSDYYYNAAKYLGLATSVKDEDTKTEYRQATEKAVSIFSKTYKEKYELLAAEVLKIQTVAESYLMWIRSGIKPSKTQVIEIFRASQESENLSPSTIERRASTILSWASWVYALTENEAK